MRGTDYVGAPPPDTEQGPPTGRRVALVIGNGGYKNTSSLKNPVNDARAMDKALRNLGFEIVGGEANGLDLTHGALYERIRDFSRTLREGAEVATALLFYAGHGLQVRGRNFLVPVDASLNHENDVLDELIELQSALDRMERLDLAKLQGRTNIVLLDACRNNPLARNLARAMGLADTRAAGITEGLAEQKVVAGTLIAYATQPEHVAYDGDGANGFFTEALLADMATPGLEIRVLLSQVRSRVYNKTLSKARGPQVPWDHSSLMGAFYFRPAATTAPVAPPQPPSDQGDAGTSHVALMQLAASEWDRIKATDDIEHLELFRTYFPNTYYAAMAHDRIDELKRLDAQRRQREEQLQKHEAAWENAKREDVPGTYEQFMLDWPQSPNLAEARKRSDELIREMQAQAERLAAERKAAELAQRHEAEWQAAEFEDTAKAYERFLAVWNEGAHVEAARTKLADARRRDAASVSSPISDPVGTFQKFLSTFGGLPSPAQSITSLSSVGKKEDRKSSLLRPGESIRDLDIGPEMVLIPPGKFWMGSKDGEGMDDEHPRHEVTIGYPLLVGKYPITFAEWDAAQAHQEWQKHSGIAARRPSDYNWGRGKRPVLDVNWQDAKAFAAWLSHVSGTTYRLLSEAEWEYCCRAGTTTTYSFGDKITKAEAQFSENAFGSAKQTVEVGNFPANPFGLHDMHGNVWEWCEDEWHPNYDGAPNDGSPWSADGDAKWRVVRGGSWSDIPRNLRSAYRDGGSTGNRSGNLGFRVARTLSPL